MPAPPESATFAMRPAVLKTAATLPDVVTAKGGCPGPAGNFDTGVPRPCAEAINIGHSSTWVINYRNEPIGQRIYDPNAPGVGGLPGAQAAGMAGDLAFALQSRTDRAFDTQEPARALADRPLNTSFGDMPYPTSGDNCDGINCGGPSAADDTLARRALLKIWPRWKLVPSYRLLWVSLSS